eukprot:8088806-Karenia_brevis.AAC.1
MLARHRNANKEKGAHVDMNCIEMQVGDLHHRLLTTYSLRRTLEHTGVDHGFALQDTIAPA